MKPLRINLIGNPEERKGLWVDACVLRERFEAWGHAVADVQFTAPTAPEADLNIFLEVYRPRLNRFAARAVLIPNVEQWIDYEQTQGVLQHPPDALWAKTQHAVRVLHAMARHPHARRGILTLSERTHHIGFTTRYAPQALPETRDAVFLHAAGASRYRNTEAVYEAWRRFWRPGIPPLVIVARGHRRPAKMPPGVTWHEHLGEAAYRQLFRACAYHVLPSMAEGYGHALWEARAVGAVVVTTEAPPMNEGPGVAVPVNAWKDLRGRAGCPVRWAAVSPEGVWQAARRVAEAKPAEIAAHQMASRQAWEAGREAFEDNLKRELDAVTAVRAAA